jgi:hypothetical protein
MHHVADARDTMQYTLSDISVKARRLLIDVDQPVFLAGDDDDRHFQIGVVLLRCKRVGYHESCLRGAGADLARPKSHFFRKTVELPGNRRRSKYLPHKEWPHKPRQNGRDGVAQVITATKLRAFERHQLEQRLKDDKHAAQVASETLQQIEHQIGVKTLALRFLDNRFQRYVRSAVVEAARESDLGERYLQKIGELREVLLQLLGLGSVVGSTDKFYHAFPTTLSIRSSFRRSDYRHLLRRN